MLRGWIPAAAVSASSTLGTPPVLLCKALGAKSVMRHSLLVVIFQKQGLFLLLFLFKLYAPVALNRLSTGRWRGGAWSLLGHGAVSCAGVRARKGSAACCAVTPPSDRVRSSAEF